MNFFKTFWISKSALNHYQYLFDIPLHLPDNNVYSKNLIWGGDGIYVQTIIYRNLPKVYLCCSGSKMI